MPILEHVNQPSLQGPPRVPADVEALPDAVLNKFSKIQNDIFISLIIYSSVHFFSSFL